MCYNTHIVHPPSTGDASKPTRNGLSFIPMALLSATAFTGSEASAIIEVMKERKSRLKERGLIHLTFRRKQMAQVTYRGVSYDTEAYRKELLAEASKQRNFDLMYRGIKTTSNKARPCS